ncbi:hypothetical protein DP107_17665 [Haloglomus irregulare]|jgi:uncharacterized protein YprB with RNaseH-like and TPR domain|uniref:RNase_H superfamily protein n=1 Tax=Haloglomus irregulare TaxID=2234134 RepID=A0A554MUY1_9EURY|nr:hypothetical protein [Haloglomus irregulare]TSD08899.1 hypothetical protein DP107_17665 [Haloglomus irregulare]
MTELDTIAFDIETTGFHMDDQLTVVRFDADIGSRIFLNTDGRAPPPNLEARVNEELATAVSISVQQTERTLLSEMDAFVESTLTHQDVKLVAHNGERWNGGFDLPFLRTRLCYHDIDWPFAELSYIDAMDVFETRFNTSGDTLTAVYEELIGSGLTGLDPFVDSEEAVGAWEEEDFESLVRHNVADIRRTRALMRLAERYCSKSDFSMKSLDPVA